MKFNIVLFCAFHCTFDHSVSNCHIRKFAKNKNDTGEVIFKDKI